MKKTNRKRIPPPAVCPVCSEDVPRSALACPQCGADHNSGWRENADVYDGIDLGDEQFDYDEFVQNEFGSRVKKRTIAPIWWITAILLVIAFAALYLYRR